MAKKSGGSYVCPVCAKKVKSGHRQNGVVVPCKNQPFDVSASLPAWLVKKSR